MARGVDPGIPGAAPAWALPLTNAKTKRALGELRRSPRGAVFIYLKPCIHFTVPNELMHSTFDK
jgi:hypothetical protein